MQTGFTGSRMVFAHVVIIGSWNLESKAKFQQSIDSFCLEQSIPVLTNVNRLQMKLHCIPEEKEYIKPYKSFNLIHK